MRQQPEQQAPPVQRLRVRYTKRGRLRFTSHRDFSRAFERAIQRAGLPMAYSSGFNPHPRISYANAAPTGAASEAEYLEIGLAQVCDAEQVRGLLDSALPEGLDVLEVVESPGGSLADRLEASNWQMRLPGVSGLQPAVDALLATDEVLVERMTKKGLREFDARGAVVSLRLLEDADGSILGLVLRHGVPAVRPDDVLQALARCGGEAAEVALARATPLLTRLMQGPFDAATGTVHDPLRSSA